MTLLKDINILLNSSVKSTCWFEK